MKAGRADASLGDLAEINPRGDRPAGDTPVSFVPMAALDAATGETSAVETRPYSAVAKGYSQFRRDDLLVAKITPCFENGKIGRATTQHELGAGSTEFHVVRPDTARLDPSYALHFLRSGRVRRTGELRMIGSAGQRRVPERFLAALSIPLPPLYEQRRIARVLGAADRLRATRRGALTHFDALASAHFMASFGDPDENPLGWDLRPVSVFVSSFDGGKSFAGEDDDDSQAPYRVLRVSAVTSGEFMPEESRPVPRGYSPPSGHHVRPGDLLISRANTSALVGAVALVDRATDGLLLPDKIWRFSWRDDEAAVPEFVWQLFRTRAIRIAITRRSTGTSGSMKNISAEKLMGIEVIQPPVDHQREFARVFRHTRRLRAKATRQLSDLDALFASLQHRAFTGAL